MATTIPSTSPIIELLRKHKTSALSQSTTQATEYPIHDLLHSVYPAETYTEHEKSEISQWLTTSTHIGSSTEDAAKSAERLSHLNTHLSGRTTVLGSKPSIADLALYARLAPLVAGWSDEQRTGEQGHHHIVRHLLFVQSSPRFDLTLSDGDKLQVSEDNVLFPIKPIDPKAEKERKKREKEAAAAGGTIAAKDAIAPGSQKQAKKGLGDTVAAAVAGQVPLSRSSDGASKELSSPTNATANGATPVAAVVAPSDEAKPKPKKEKPPKQKKAAEPPKETPLSPALIDLRVGHILKCELHPNADSLFVSTMCVGDPPGTDNTHEYDGRVVRTVCSGLNGLVPIEEMQGRKVVAVCNLKPVTMRGVKSCAMVLAASPRLKDGEEDAHKGPVELVEVPADSEAGERVAFEGWEGEPEGVLNPKKKIWEMCQAGFTTTDGAEVAFDAAAVEKLKEEGRADGAAGRLKTKSGGLCTVKTLKGATVR